MVMQKDEYEDVMPGEFPSSVAAAKPPLIKENPPVPSITSTDTGSDIEKEFVSPPSRQRSSASKAKESINAPLMIPGSSSNARRRAKVVLKPGYSPLDWARKISSEKSFPVNKKVKPSELAMHNTRYDAWGAFNQRVYNLTEYMDYHPGGVRELLRAAGRDGTGLFLEYHPWINIEGLLGVYYVGMLVDEDSDDT